LHILCFRWRAQTTQPELSYNLAVEGRPPPTSRRDSSLMALDFSGNIAARVDHGTAAALANLQVGTSIIWCRPASFSAFRRICQRGGLIWWWTPAGMQFTIARASQSQSFIVPSASFGALAVDTEI